MAAIVYSDAIDEMFGLVNAQWQQSNAIFGYIPELRWPGMEKAAKPDSSKLWARVSVQIVNDTQDALADSNGVRKYHAIGLLFIQLFCPRTDADLANGRLFAQFIREAFRGAGGDLVYTNQRIMELPPNDQSYPINIVIKFEYDNLSGQVANGNPIVPALIARGKHFPVEAIDGIRTVFSFVGLPANAANFALVFWNGVAQDGYAQNGITIDLGSAPKPANGGFPADTLYAIY